MFWEKQNLLLIRRILGIFSILLDYLKDTLKILLQQKNKV